MQFKKESKGEKITRRVRGVERVQNNQKPTLNKAGACVFEQMWEPTAMSTHTQAIEDTRCQQRAGAPAAGTGRAFNARSSTSPAPASLLGLGRRRARVPLGTVTQSKKRQVLTALSLNSLTVTHSTPWKFASRMALMVTNALAPCSWHGTLHLHGGTASDSITAFSVATVPGCSHSNSLLDNLPFTFTVSSIILHV